MAKRGRPANPQYKQILLAGPIPRNLADICNQEHDRGYRLIAARDIGGNETLLLFEKTGRSSQKIDP
jgi:hypothetical protein